MKVRDDRELIWRHNNIEHNAEVGGEGQGGGGEERKSCKGSKREVWANYLRLFRKIAALSSLPRLSGNSNLTNAVIVRKHLFTKE